MLYALLSFLRVTSYVAAQLRNGQLLQNENSPMPFVVPGMVGWVFVSSVLALLFLQSVLYMILVMMGLSLLIILNGRTADEQFGFGRLSLSKLLTWSLLICGAVLFIEMPLTEVIEQAMNAIHLPHPEQQTVEDFKQLKQPAEIFGFMLQAVLLSPLIEEFFFRGFLLMFLKKYTSTLLAIFLSAGVFAAAHANLDSIIPLWFLGIVLSVAYQHTGSLLLPIGIHASWNFFTAVGLLLEKGNS